MDIYQYSNDLVSNLREDPFKLERDIQRIFEKNLAEIAGLEFVKSEFVIQNQRIDTLAFDSESKSFVIIEYKRGHHYSVFDQGVSYLNTLLKFKADFILEYNESLHRTLKKNDVDWSQSKVVFVSPSFNNTQKQAVDFQDLNIELWEIKRFQNNIIAIDGVQKSNSAPSIKIAVSKDNNELSEVAKEIKTYTEENYLKDKPDDIVEIYQRFKNAIFDLSPDIQIVPKKLYMAFKKNKKNIIDIQVLRGSLKIYINMKKDTLNDSKGLTQDISTIGHWGNGDYRIIVKDTENLEYIMSVNSNLKLTLFATHLAK